MHTIVYILAAVAVVTGLVSTISVMPAINGQNETAAPVANETLQEGENITITAAENQTEAPPAPENQTANQNETQTQTEQPVNATEPEPQVLTEPGPEGPFNITAVQEPEEATITVSLADLQGNNVTIIEPDGNVTEIPDVNVTQVDNDTVVIAPPVENVTTIPETNVTIITPAPEECECILNETGEPEPLAPVIVRPAPGQQVTIEGGEVTVENETGVVVQGQGNSTDPQLPPPQPAEGNTNATSSGNSTGVSPAAFSEFAKWFSV